MYHSAGVICVCPDTRTFLILQSKFNNKWSFPKGYIEKDETPLVCALRELNEEIGVQLTDKDLLCLNNELLTINCDMHLPKPVKKVPDGVKRICFYVTQMKTSQSIQISREHKKYLWIDFTNNDHIQKLRISQDYVNTAQEVLELLHL